MHRYYYTNIGILTAAIIVVASLMILLPIQHSYSLELLARIILFQLFQSY
jgi:hypothetical protein